jgi:hypothetical protein
MKMEEENQRREMTSKALKERAEVVTVAGNGNRHSDTEDGGGVGRGERQREGTVLRGQTAIAPHA